MNIDFDRVKEKIDVIVQDYEVYRSDVFEVVGKALRLCVPASDYHKLTSWAYYKILKKHGKDCIIDANYKIKAGSPGEE